MIEKVLGWIIGAGIFTTLIMGCVFIVAYHVRTKGRWRKSSIGRHLMSFMGGETLIVVIAAFAICVPDFPYLEYFAAFSWILLPVLFGWRAYIMVRVDQYDILDGNVRKRNNELLRAKAKTER